MQCADIHWYTGAFETAPSEPTISVGGLGFSNAGTSASGQAGGSLSMAPLARHTH